MDDFNSMYLETIVSKWLTFFKCIHRLKRDLYFGKRTKRGLFESNDKRKLNADINGSLNILRKSSNKQINFSNKIFNLIKIKDINAICDVVYFKWQPTNTGCVFQPNNVYIK